MKGRNSDIPAVSGNSRLHESLLYGVIWLIVFIFPLLLTLVDIFNDTQWSWRHVWIWWINILPYMLIFLIHNHLIVRKYIFTLNLKGSSLSVVLILLLLGAFQYCRHSMSWFGIDLEILGPPPGVLPPADVPAGIIPLPVIMDVVIGMFVIGTNLAIAVLFNYQRHREYLKTLENMKLQDELRYLKAQINPHFFMNMLNNIHGMIELDPAKAQDMILNLSRMMRYVLREGDRSRVPLAAEVEYLSTYVSVMRQRYMEDRVEVVVELPGKYESVMIPPLLFVSFVENAFKHGVSYLRKTLITISLELQEDRICFMCRNTVNNEKPLVKDGGVGLENTRRRLSLLYGEDYSLDIQNLNDEYIVKLIIPCQSNVL